MFLFRQESDEIPSDFTRLFNTRLFSISTSLVPSAIKSYHELNVKHEPLKLITPQFETPLPPLQAAVFPPSFRYKDSNPVQISHLLLHAMRASLHFFLGHFNVTMFFLSDK